MAIFRFRMTTMDINPNSMPDFHVVILITFSKCKINIDVQLLLKICPFCRSSPFQTNLLYSHYSDNNFCILGQPRNISWRPVH